MISVIIPAYNEEKALPETLRRLVRQPGDYEVIVVDGGSTDRTRSIAESFGFGAGESESRRSSLVARRSPDASRDTLRASRVLLSAPKGRASQMNAGAKQAAGEILLFLHADTFLPEGAIVRLNGMERDGLVQAGGFRHRFSGSDWRLALISCLDNVRCLRSRIIYGDQALFVRRSLFERLGGFPDRPILEDVAFGERLLRVTRPILLDPPVLTDSRKFVQMGVWRSFIRVLLIILHVQFRLPILPRAFFQDVR
ncbi:MAG: TIGR04283 family arsenosugar biosynthesis glycosyltransferase [Nitrospirota bacterium]|nr:TIGR04283 family arsenosugar biosynthesis glycosyltransferase [Nitrospirota bacterium]MDE3241684.1 TIGR04283 family arsenosugar biosynthesis glycosyltransferase [Nitrospirota bacterium]